MGAQKTPATHKKPQSYRLSEDTLDKLRAMAMDYGVSQAIIVQLAVREYWRQNGSDEMLEEYHRHVQQNW